MQKNTYNAVTKAQYNKELKKHEFFSKYAKIIDEIYGYFGDDDFCIYVGDIEEKGQLKFSVPNTVILGNLKANWINCINNFEQGYDEGGSLFVKGNIECNYFSGEYAKLVVIDGNLTVNKILNNAYADSTLKVSGNLKTEFFNGLDIWAVVGGKVEMIYGNGYCLPIGYKNANQESIRPKYDEMISHKFLNIDSKIKEYRDPEDLVRDLIIQLNSK